MNMNNDENKKLLVVYRNNNLLLKDQLETKNEELEKLKKALDETKEFLKKEIEQKLYWKHKHDKKSAWINFGYT